MKKKLFMSIGAIAGAVILGLGIYHSEASQTESGLSEEEIKEQVTAQYPGDITDIKLEKQANKSVYLVDIKDAPRAYMLTLDSNTGEVMELKETSDPEQVKIAEKQEKEKEKQKEKENQGDQKSRDTEKKPEKGNSHSQQKKNNDNQSKSSEKEDTVISFDEAIDIALDQFSGEIDEIELEKEDGRLIYEIEIENGDEEAEIEIDAYTGEVLVVSIEEDD